MKHTRSIHISARNVSLGRPPQAFALRAEYYSVEYTGFIYSIPDVTRR